MRNKDRQVNTVLRETADRLRLLAEHTSDLIYSYRFQPTRGFAYVSPSATRITGYTPEEHYADPDLGFKIVLPEDRPLLEAASRGEFDPTQPITLRWVRKDGTVIWTEQRNVPIYDEQGRLVAIEGIARDVTERVQREQELVETTRLNQILLNAFPHPLFLVRAETRVIAAANAAAAAIGAVAGTHCYTAWAHRDTPCPWCPGSGVWQEQEMHEQELELDGVVWEAHWVPIDRDLFLHFFVDITKHRRSEEQLRESEERFHSLFDNAVLGIYRTTPDGRILMANPALLHMLGYSSFEELAQRDLEQEGYEPSYERSMFKRRVETEGQVIGMESAWVRRDGATIFVRESARAVRAPDGTVLYYEGTVEDITDRRYAELALREERRLLRTLIDSVPGYIYVKDANSRFLVANAVLARDLGAAGPEQLVGTTDADHYPPEMAERYRTDELMVMQSARPLVGREEPVIIPSTGEQRWFLTTKVPLRDASGQISGVVGIGRDITERKRAEETARDLNARLERMYDEAARLAERSAHLHRSVQEIVQAVPNRERLYTAIHRAASELMPCEAFVIVLRDDDHHENEGVYLIDRGQRFGGQRFPADGGLSGLIIACGQTVLIGDLSTEDSDPYLHFGGSDSVRSVLAVPLRVGERTIGMLSAQSYEPNVYTTEDKLLLEMLGAHAGAVIETVRLLEETRLHAERLSALREIDLAITGSVDLRVSLNVMLGHLTTQLHVDAADVLVLQPRSQVLEYAAGRGFRTAALQHTQLRIGEGYAGHAALERGTVRVPDLRREPNGLSRSPLLAQEGFVTYYALPLIAKGEVRGVLELFHRAPLELDAASMSYLDMLAGQAAVAIDNASLFANLQRSHAELIMAYDSTLEGWARAVDLRDRETEEHTVRAAEVAVRLGRMLGMSESDLVHLRRGALLHDIGKMAVPDHILFKAGPLTTDEMEIVRKHPVWAYEMLSPISFLRPALDVPYCHHERWDGSGYPRGLKGEQIPLSARIFSVVDVWDALVSDRPYRAAWSEEQATAYLREQAGRLFDARVVEAFLRLRPLLHSGTS